MRYFHVLIIIICAILLSSANLQAMTRTIQAQWTHQSISGLAGFRLYHENNLACEVQDPSATSIQCTMDISDGETWFTLTAFYDNGVESDHSAPYTKTFSSTLDAAFSASSSGGEAPHTVSFNAASSTGDITSYQWAFGDGETASGSTADHTFTATGTYTVTLEVTDSSNATDQQTTEIVITDPAGGNSPPMASLTSSSGIGEAPLAVELDASGSSDSDGEIVSYAWDLGDGTTASGATVNHTYIVAGTYNPQVTVTDNGGLTDSASVPVLVQSAGDINTPPIAVISASANRGKVPLKVVFSGNKSSDEDGTVTAYYWNFGDGSTARSKTVDHNFKTIGKYTVSLIVQDNDGTNSQPATFQIEVLSKKDSISADPSTLQPIINLLLNTSEPAAE